jgi:hypothetical protein
MFLIEIKQGEFINAEVIDYISIIEQKVEFTLSGDGWNYKVDKDYIGGFLNHLQALNNNITSISARFRELSE